MVKMLFYFVLAIVFLLTYQKYPTFILIIVGMGLGIFLFSRVRKNKNKGENFKFFKNKKSGESNNIDHLMVLLLYQNLLGSLNSRDNDKDHSISIEKKKRIAEIDNIKREVLELLENK